MPFESLTGKLQDIFKNLRGKGRLSESDVKEAMKEIRRALLAADVNYKVVKDFINQVQERAIGQDVLNGLNPGQTVIKIVNEEMIKLMGSETTEIDLLPGNATTVIMMVGLQGAGKTTTAAKLAGKFKSRGKRPLLAALDVYRPAAIKQLQVDADKVGASVFSMGENQKPADIAKAAYEHARKHGNNVLILDTAGRLHIDEEMMQELKDIKAAVDVHQTILVIDAMTGQDAVNVAKEFNEEVGIDGVIISKMDGDTRGGAALSVKAVTGKPILFTGTGEKMDDLEQFYPDRMASRILGMGDVLTFIEKAGNGVDTEQAVQMNQKLKKNKFDYDDFLTSIKQMNDMGGLGSIMDMIPGIGGMMGGRGRGKVTITDQQTEDAEKRMARMEAMIYSMTPQERSNPDLLNPSRKNRIAKGAGVSISEVNKMVKQFNDMKKMMKQYGKPGKRGRMRMPF